jgi:peptidoglycan/LPS O-acetylase OafA/YrhL
VVAISRYATGLDASCRNALYAIAPFIVKRPARLIGIFIASMIVRYFIYAYISTNDPWISRFFPSEAAFFCLGALAFHVYGATKKFGLSREVGFILFVVMLLYITNFNRVPVFVGNTFLFSGSLLQFYGFAFVALPFVFHLTRDNRVDRWLGELSYPIYLTHLFVIQGASHLPHLFGTQVYNNVLNTLVISAAINAIVQTPIERWFKRPEQQMAPARHPLPSPPDRHAGALGVARAT